MRWLGLWLGWVARAYASLYEFYDHIDQFMLPPFEDYGDAKTIGAEVRGRYEVVPDRLGVTAGTEANYNVTQSHSFTLGAGDDVFVPKNINISALPQYGSILPPLTKYYKPQYSDDLYVGTDSVLTKSELAAIHLLK